MLDMVHSEDEQPCLFDTEVMLLCRLPRRFTPRNDNPQLPPLRAKRSNLHSCITFGSATKTKRTDLVVRISKFYTNPAPNTPKKTVCFGPPKPFVVLLFIHIVYLFFE